MSAATTHNGGRHVASRRIQILPSIYLLLNNMILRPARDDGSPAGTRPAASRCAVVQDDEQDPGQAFRPASRAECAAFGYTGRRTEQMGCEPPGWWFLKAEMDNLCPRCCTWPISISAWKITAGRILPRGSTHGCRTICNDSTRRSPMPLRQNRSTSC